MSDVKPLLLVILDGWGYGDKDKNNAVHVADTPNMDRWMETYPFTTLVAHNGAVGLPEGQMGNSEVGHLNIGAGRVVYQDFTRINHAIERGTFYENEVLLDTTRKAAASGKTLHLLGLLSDGGVHSHINHLIALVKLAGREGVENIMIHAFMDGRDTPPSSGASYMQQLQEALQKIGKGKVATITGRYYAMDRDNRWGRVQKAWHALVDGKGRKSSDPVQAIEEAYALGETDEFIKPVVLVDKDDQRLATIADGDSVIFFNFRADRARQLAQALTDTTCDAFEYRMRPHLAECVTFTSYDKQFTMPVAFPPVALQRILGEEISRHGLRQLRIAETEKYAHVTYFFNGGAEEPFANEDRVLIPSPKEVATYDQKPEMSAYLVTEELLNRLQHNQYGFIVLNFANGDMVGHTGVMEAAVRACEAVDQCLGKLVAEVTGQGGMVLITADHGNAEIMEDPETKESFTAHSSNPVPFILISEKHRKQRLRKSGTLTDIAPTVLGLMNIPVPKEMKGKCLLEESA